jgi:ABC-2 type transport system ATP-binding protein
MTREVVADQLTVNQQTAAISAAGLARSFGGKAAVQGIALDVDEGSIFGLLGPNGAGKTTVVRMLTTLLAPGGGWARVAGLDVARQAAQLRRVIGVALQETALDPLMTGHELLRLQAALHGVSGDTARRRVGALLDQMELAGVASHRVKTYSGGTKRRLDLALALVHTPKVLFLDEPTTGIDPPSRQAIWDQVRALSQEQGTTVFLTTQYLEEADRLCDQVAIMDHGTIARFGSPERLKVEVDVPTLRVTVPTHQRERAAGILSRFGPARPGLHGALGIGLTGGPPAVADAVRALDEGCVIIEHLQLDLPSLEDVFADATGRRMPAAAHEEPGRVGADMLPEQG